LLGLYLVISSIYTLFYLTKKRSHLAVLIWSFIIVILVAFLGSIFTSKSVGTEWYQSIKPSITPPSFVFPIAWSILFFLIALSLYLVWIFSTKQEKRKIILVYGLNFVLNILWSVLYFGLHQTKLAFFEIIILFLSILLMISVSYKIKRMSSYLLVPYLLWVGFASVLTYLSAFI
jgi:tryptophan-rich sensory protein